MENDMELTSLIWFLLIGLIAGWLASMIMKSPHGALGDIVIGVVGALLGGWLFGVLGISAGGGLVGSLITALVGAILLILLLRVIRRA